MKELRISEEFLDQILNQQAKTLVGVAMKRFELTSDTTLLKNEMKELIYENYRSLKTLLKSFNCGVKFITPSK